MLFSLILTTTALVLPTLGNPVPIALTYPTCGGNNPNCTKIDQGVSAFETAGKIIWSDSSEVYIKATKGGDLPTIHSSPKFLANLLTNASFPDITTALTTTHSGDFGTDLSKIRVVIGYAPAWQYKDANNTWVKLTQSAKDWCTKAGFECLKSECGRVGGQFIVLAEDNDIFPGGYETGPQIPASEETLDYVYKASR